MSPFGYPIFFDTEFSSWVNPELISVGLVDLSGRREFYAEIMGVSRRNCSDFVREEVLPLLEGGWFAMGADHCKAGIKQFIEAAGIAVVAVSDFLDHDWMLFTRLMQDYWPVNLSCNAYMFDPGSEASHPRVRDEACAAKERYFLEGYPIHHALHDARALRNALVAACNVAGSRMLINGTK